MRIDLNADLGESFGVWTLGDDEALMRSITSANVACGYHAGDPAVMRRTVALARQAGVAVGAHPSLPDLAGFGRRAMAISPAEAGDLVLYQVGALAAIASAEGMALQHVKPHGALYDMAARDVALARGIVQAIVSFDRSLVVFAPPGSALLEEAAAAGLPTAAEGFVDRGYEPDGSLTPRGRPGASVRDPGEVVSRGVRMVREGLVRTRDGSDLRLRVGTLCTHGDTPGASELVRQLRAGLTAAGVVIAPPAPRGPAR